MTALHFRQSIQPVRKRAVALSCLLALALPALSKAGDREDATAAYRADDVETARRHLTALAQMGDAVAANQLGALAESGRTGPIDYALARRWYERAARQGNAQAQNNLGMMYLDGRGVRIDYKAARSWFLRSARQGFSPAQFNLGILYMPPRGAPVDYVKARGYFALAASQGLADAELNLGVMNRDGEGGPVDFVKAREFYLRAAQHGSTQAAFQLGVLYVAGQGGPVDYVMAREWFLKAGDEQSVAYVDAKLAGERGDRELERSLLTPIAERGSSTIAEYDLGMLLVSAPRGTNDYAEGVRWLRKAAEGGWEPAAKALKSLPGN